MLASGADPTTGLWSALEGLGAQVNSDVNLIHTNHRNHTKQLSLFFFGNHRLNAEHPTMHVVLNDLMGNILQ